jgi:catechol 2,3-dioxygenase-like lactoylglutathione lyase family enzyme
MITSVDHLSVRASFAESAVGAYETLLGRRADGGQFRLANVGLKIVDDAATARLSEMVFATESLDEAERLLKRRAIEGVRRSSDAGDRLELSSTATHGTPIALIQRKDMPVPSLLKDAREDAAISALDHVVIRTPDPERAVALYGGRLGLDLRLDRSNPDWGSRLLFFRCGDVVVEVVHDLKKGIGTGPDTLWGLAWRAADIELCHERLRKASVETSELRAGRRPGTQVFTVKSHTANVPTLVLGGAGHWQ